MKDLSEIDMPRVDFFTASINSMNWQSACLFTICALKRVMPIWDQDVKKKYIIYADHVVGIRHKISKKILGEYLLFLESNFDFWGIKEKVDNSDILELWVALTDFDFEVTPNATKILYAVFELMSAVQKISNNLQFIESLARCAMIFENWDDFEQFLSEVREDFTNHPLYERIQNTTY